jgi:tight adherence protein C
LSYFVKLILLTAGTLCFLGDLLLLFLSRNERVEKTGIRALPLEDLFGIGFYLQKKGLWRRSLSRERTKKLEEFYSSAMAEKIDRNAAVAPITYFVLSSPLLCLCLFFSEDFFFLLVELALLGFLFFSFDWWLKQQTERRHEELALAYPAMLTKMALTVQAGVPATEAFRQVAFSGEGPLYEEMKKVVDTLNHGRGLEDALAAFSSKCPLREVQKFVSLFLQNQSKGDPDFSRSLSELAEGAWENRKNRAKKKGEAAKQKLLGPTLLMFLGLLLMIMIPAFQNLF